MLSGMALCEDMKPRLQRARESMILALQPWEEEASPWTAGLHQNWELESHGDSSVVRDAH